MRYIVTKNIETPNKVVKHIMVFDFLFVLTYMGIVFALKNLVHPSLRIVFFIFSFLMAVFLTAKSVFNKERRNYESIIMMLQRDTNVYKSYIERNNEDEES